MLTVIKKIIPNKLKRNINGVIRNIINTIQYYFLEGKLLADRQVLKQLQITKIIFVCKGNVCRSAFAEQRFRDLLVDKTVYIDSCGVDVDQGNYPPRDSVKIAAVYGCSLTDRRAKGLNQCDIQGADLIFPVEYWQYKRLVALYPEKRNNIMLLRTVAPFPYSLFCNIADPYSWGADEFRRCYRMVDRCLAGLAGRF